MFRRLLIAILLVVFSVPSVIALADTNTYEVTVNYSQPLKKAVKVGGYDWVDRYIVQGVGISTTQGSIGKARAKSVGPKQRGQADVSIVLVEFNDDVTTDDVLAVLDQRGMRAATLPELLALGAKYPDLQRQFWIVALGSPYRGPDNSFVVPIFHPVGDAVRGLYLYSMNVGWKKKDPWQFAVVRR
jgi:hypothetical protein